MKVIVENLCLRNLPWIRTIVLCILSGQLTIALEQLLIAQIQVEQVEALICVVSYCNRYYEFTKQQQQQQRKLTK